MPRHFRVEPSSPWQVPHLYDLVVTHRRSSDIRSFWWRLGQIWPVSAGAMESQEKFPHRPAGAARIGKNAVLQRIVLGSSKVGPPGSNGVHVTPQTILRLLRAEALMLAAAGDPIRLPGDARPGASTKPLRGPSALARAPGRGARAQEEDWRERRRSLFCFSDAFKGQLQPRSTPWEEQKDGDGSPRRADASNVCRSQQAKQCSRSPGSCDRVDNDRRRLGLEF